MAAPGTITHVLEVARRLVAADAAHVASIQDTASAADTVTPAAADAPPAAGGH